MKVKCLYTRQKNLKWKQPVTMYAKTKKVLFVQFFMQFFNFNEYFIKCNKFKQILRMKVEERKPLFLVWNYSVVVGWEPEGYDDISTMFHWEPEGCYRHWLLYSNNALLILNRTLLNSDNALLALNWRCDNRMFLHNLESIRTIQEYQLQHHIFLITITKLCKETFRPKRWIKMVLTILAPFSLSSNFFKDYLTWTLQTWTHRSQIRYSSFHSLEQNYMHFK